MQIIPTHLTGGGVNSGNDTSYTTNSISPAANSLLLVGIEGLSNGHGGNRPTGNTPSLSGLGLTWITVTSFSYGNTSGGSIIVYYAYTGSSPASGTLAIDFAGQQQDESFYSIDQFQHVNVGGVNGANAIVQHNQAQTTATSTEFFTNLNPFRGVNNLAYGFATTMRAGTPGVVSPFTVLSTATSLAVAYALNQTAVPFISGAGETAAAIAIEIAAASPSFGFVL